MDAQQALLKGSEIKALVVGDVMLDSYLLGRVNRISPEAPVPIVDIQKQEKRLGGAANVVRNLIALNVDVFLASVIGKDAAGATINAMLEEQGVRTDGLIQSADRPTTIKTRVISQGQQLLRVDEELTTEISSDLEEKLVASCTNILKNESIDVLIFEDYDKGVLTDYVIQKLIACAKQEGIKVTVDPKFRNFNLYKGVDLFKPNLKELAEGLAMTVVKSQDESIFRALKKMHDSLHPLISLVTISERGVCAYAPELNVDFQRIPAFEREITDVSGAGDAVIAVASLLLALDVPVCQIAAVSNLAGGLVCEKIGVVPVHLGQLQREWDHHHEAMKASMQQS